MFDLIFLAAVYHESEALSGESAACHAKPQHMGFAAPLGIASKASGEALVLGRGDFAVMKLPCFFPELLQVGKKNVRR